MDTRRRGRLRLAAVLIVLAAAVAGFATTTRSAVVSAAPTSATDETRIPHYFGPYSNWANSPQVLPDAVVSLSGGGGSGAEASATVDPKTGAVTGITVTSPGSGYTAPPDVTITSPGITPTTAAAATAAISLGVVKSIAVNEAGFGFTAPAVTLTGGNPTPGSEATAVASGGVDNLVIADGGSGYTLQPTVEFSLPDLPGGTPATGSATMDANGVVDSVTVVDPGSGYTSAPTVTILDGNKKNPQGAATVTATIGIGQIDVTAGGQGYDTAPTVTIADTVGVADKGASATATIAARGAVTDIAVTTAGAGYLTPGIKKFVDGLAGLGPNGANDLGNSITVAPARHHHLPGHRLLRDRRRPVPAEVPPRPAGDPAARLRAAVDERHSRPAGGARQREPRPDPAGHPDRGLHRGRQAELPRPDDRRDEEPAGADPVPEPAPDR